MADQHDDLHALLNDSGETTEERAIARAKEEYDQCINVALDIAVTGETGAGKSSFVNAIRGLKYPDEGAAPTGVTDTTMEPTEYPHPNLPNVKIWDLPGSGSPRFSASTYIKKVNFQKYDFFIIVSSSRFKESDIMLAKEIKKKKKNFYFVRTKVDQDVRNEEESGVPEEQTLQKMRDDCVKNLRELGSPPVFLITSRDLSKFDFAKLVEALEKDLPDHKRNALVLSLPVYSQQSLEKKYNRFKIAVWALAVVSGAIGAAPVPGLSPACDLAMVASFFTSCYFSFGLDDKSLTKLGERVNKPILEMVRKSSLVVAIAGKSFLTTKLAARLAAAGVIEGLCSVLPVAGNIAAAGVSFVTTRAVLQEGLDELYGVAQRVLEMAGLE